MANVRENIRKYPAKIKGINEYGTLYEVILDLRGANGKTAKVLTGWIDGAETGVMRLTTIRVD